MKMEATPKGSSFYQEILPWTSAIVWPLMSTVPLLLTNKDLPFHYSNIFPHAWYHYDEESIDHSRPKPLGLVLGIFAVFIGHVFLIPTFYLYRKGFFSTDRTIPKSIQTSGERQYFFMEGLTTHLSQPEGFVLLSLYLTMTWMYDLMPKSYYSFYGTIQWSKVFLCLATQDCLQYVMHRLEHRVSPEFYKKSHKPHHRFTNPRLFDAFNGSIPDTVLMILLPLYATANIVRDCNIWTYMAFGSMYANWLVLIHSEYVFPWDGIFRKLGLGTPGDHHVHHKVFKYNYGHLFMWFDQLGGTYRDPQCFAPKLFNYGT
jgi:sterol desaturase/sphingolipid hydroxylase (fatty acid hydroxylase superfamily)